MAQNKLNIVLLAVVFAASVAAGYFIADIVMPKKQVVEVYEEPETVDETDYYQEDTVQYVEEPVVEEEVVVEEETPVEPEVVLPVYEQYTAAEMEALINSGDYLTYKPENSKEIFVVDWNHNIKISNMPAGVSIPQTVSELCDNKGIIITEGKKWLGVKNVTLRYNERNQVTGISLDVIWEGEYEN